MKITKKNYLKDFATKCSKNINLRLKKHITSWMNVQNDAFSGSFFKIHVNCLVEAIYGRWFDIF